MTGGVAALAVAVLAAAAVLVRWPARSAGPAEVTPGHDPPRTRRWRWPALRGASRRLPDVADVADLADVALVCELTAAAVEAGLPPAAALERALDAVRAAGGTADDPAVRRACAQVGLGADPATAWDAVDARWRPLTDTLVLAVRTGAPVAGLLRAAAAAERTARRRAGEEAAARAGSLLVLPLGLCVLPSFLLLGVVPVVVTVAGDLGRAP